MSRDKNEKPWGGEVDRCARGEGAGRPSFRAAWGGHCTTNVGGDEGARSHGSRGPVERSSPRGGSGLLPHIAHAIASRRDADLLPFRRFRPLRGGSFGDRARCRGRRRLRRAAAGEGHEGADDGDERHAQHQRTASATMCSHGDLTPSSRIARDRNRPRQHEVSVIDPRNTGTTLRKSQKIRNGSPEGHIPKCRETVTPRLKRSRATTARIATFRDL